jgi:hypothetical protein
MKYSGYLLLFDVASPRLTLFALELHKLDRLSYLCALWDHAVMLKECANLSVVCHFGIIFRGVIFDINGSLLFDD